MKQMAGEREAMLLRHYDALGTEIDMWFTSNYDADCGKVFNFALNVE